MLEQGSSFAYPPEEEFAAAAAEVREYLLEASYGRYRLEGDGDPASPGNIVGPLGVSTAFPLVCGGEHAAFRNGAFIHFALYPKHEPQRPVATAAQIGFHVPDFDSVHHRVLASGAKVVLEPRSEPWGKTARYLDPDGNIVSITES